MSLSLLAAGLARASDPEADPLRRLEHAVYERVNGHREQAGLARLRLDAFLEGLARQHSQQMASGAVAFGHTGLQERRAEIKRHVTLARLSENLSEHPEADLATVPQQALRIWLESPPHRVNLEGGYELTGVGAARSPGGTVFVTQIFVQTRTAD